MMKAKYTIYYSFLLVVVAHAGVLAFVLITPTQPQPSEVIPEAIQGVIVSMEPTPPPEPVKPIQQKLMPSPTPKMPVPKASPSDRAIQEPLETAVPPPAEESHVEPQVTPVTPPRTDASHINNPAPIYPTISRRLREEGVVVLEVLVLVKGTVGELRLKRSSGYSRLDETALRAVKNWHFVPAKRGAEEIDFWYELPIEFSLNR